MFYFLEQRSLYIQNTSFIVYVLKYKIFIFVYSIYFTIEGDGYQ